MGVAQLVVPFTGERFARSDRLGDLIAPPYDVIDAKTRDELLSRDPHNIVRLILPEGDGDKYQHVAELLHEWRKTGVLVSDEAAGVNVVQQTFTGRDRGSFTRTGLIAAIAVEPFSTGRVKPHEKTHAGPKEDRLALLRATQTVLDALLMLTRDDSGALRTELARVTREPPLCTAAFAGVDTALWRVRGRAADHLAELASATPLYIADGHHRYETAVSYRDEQADVTRTLGLIVPLGDPGLIVWPTHRLIHGEAFDVNHFVEGLRDWFQLHELNPDASYVESLGALRQRGTACIVTHKGGAIALLMKRDASVADLPFASEPIVASLDVARIDGIVVRALKKEAGSDATVSYSADADHVIDAVLRGHAVAGVLVNPTSVDQVLRVADAGAAMPQKATFFTPKVPSGLVCMKVASQEES